jgi:hypothetical protein
MRRLLAVIVVPIALVFAAPAQADGTLTQTECSYGLSGTYGDNERSQASSAIHAATGWTQVGGSVLNTFYRISGYPDRGRERWDYTYQASNGTRWIARVQFACRDFSHNNRVEACDDWLNWSNGPYFAGSTNWLWTPLPDPNGCVNPDPYPWDPTNT